MVQSHTFAHWHAASPQPTPSTTLLPLSLSSCQHGSPSADTSLVLHLPLLCATKSPESKLSKTSHSPYIVVLSSPSPRAAPLCPAAAPLCSPRLTPNLLSIRLHSHPRPEIEFIEARFARSISDFTAVISRRRLVVVDWCWSVWWRVVVDEGWLWMQVAPRSLGRRQRLQGGGCDACALVVAVVFGFGFFSWEFLVHG
ncbi:hypothetical protein Droror1_Dr00022840 [Drosera rotundifolia]